jgi:hypothetical protein
MTVAAALPSGIEVRLYEHERDADQVIGSFVMSVRGNLDPKRGRVNPQWPWCFIRPQILIDELKRTMTDPACKAVVAYLAERPGRLLGWCVTVPSRNEVTFAYVWYPYRREWRIGSALIRACGIDPTKPTPVRFWTRASERISLRPGWGGLYFRATSPTEEMDGTTGGPT